MNTKYWLDSTTVKAALLGAIPAIYAISRARGLDLPDGVLEDVADGVAAILNIISLVGVFIGRFKADQPLSLNK